MGILEDILRSNKKPKEIVELLAKKLEMDRRLIGELIRYFETATDSAKGNCMEAIEYATKENPEIAGDCVDFIIANINAKAPRVKWEACRIIGNVAHEFPDKMRKIVPRLIANTQDKGTVVRWSSALALTAIARADKEMQSQLVLEFKKILQKEKNKGVKNIYLKFLKEIGINKV